GRDPNPSGSSTGMRNVMIPAAHRSSSSRVWRNSATSSISALLEDFVSMCSLWRKAVPILRSAPRRMASTSSVVLPLRTDRSAFRVRTWRSAMLDPSQCVEEGDALELALVAELAEFVLEPVFGRPVDVPAERPSHVAGVAALPRHRPLDHGDAAARQAEE